MAKSLKGWTIVFDLDGTLVDSAPDLLNATNHVLQLAGRPNISLTEIRHMIGAGAKAMIRQGFELTGEAAEDREIDALWDPFIKHYQQNIAVESRLFPDCQPVLEQLLSQDAILAVCTNKQEALARQVLNELQIATHFSACFGSDSVPQRKPHGDHILLTLEAAGGSRDRAIMIGDSQTDEKAALNAGLPFIFVPFGYGPGTSDQVHSAAVVERYSNMIAAIEQISG